MTDAECIESRTMWDAKSFDTLSAEDRTTRMRDLGAYLSGRLARAVDFDAEVMRIVESLREQGHDLWSWDASDDFQTWGPDYQNRPTLRGLLIDFRTSGVDVDWLDDANPTTVRQVFGEGL